MPIKERCFCKKNEEADHMFFDKPCHDEIVTDMTPAWRFGKFYSQIRTQFLVIADSDSICHLLKKIASLGMSIDASVISEYKCNKNLLVFVLGSEYSESFPNLEALRNILECSGLEYREKKVVKIFTPTNAPGTKAAVYCALIDAVDIYAIYSSSTSGFIADTSSIKKTIAIVNHL